MKLLLVFAVASIFVPVCWNSQLFGDSFGNSHPEALSFESRVAYQRMIEEVYWRHRIWPKENSEPKPPLDKILSASAISAKVEDYLRKSDALEAYWGTPISAQQLQAEMDRMIRNTKQPAVLMELFNALNNDPQVIAECLARPILADRLIHNLYANDERFHGGLKARVESERKLTDTVEAMRAMSGTFQESVWKKKEPGAAEAKGESISLDEPEWKEWITKLQQRLGCVAEIQYPGDLPSQPLMSGSGCDLPVGKLSSVMEDAERFSVIAVLEKDNSHVKVATVEWRKQPFEEWWNAVRQRTRSEIAAPQHLYTLSPLPAAASCTDDSWSPVFVGTASARYAHTSVWTGTEMIVWGGTDNIPTNTGGRYSPSTDTWAAGGTSYTNAPSARDYHTAVWTGAEMIVWGGIDTVGYLNTGGRYNPSADTWAATSTTFAPTARAYHTAVWTGTVMIVWGGIDASSGSNTGGRYNPSTNIWAATSTTSAPTARYSHTSVWSGTEMIVWGGYDGFASTNTGGRYNPSTNSWAATSTTSAPTARDHTAVWTGTEMIVWGGYNGGYLNTGGRYNPSTDTWAAGGTSTVSAPSARRYHTVVWTGTEMIVWGGYNGSSYFNSGGRYIPSTNTWTATGSASAPSVRELHTAVWTGTEMIIWGGTSPGGYVNTGGRYNPSADTWVATSTASAPTIRSYHTAVWTGTEMIVWAGYGLGGYLNTGGRYNPSTDTWVATSMTSVPSVRELHTAVWTGTVMIVWGGDNGASNLNTGGRYNPSTNAWVATSTTSVPAARVLHTAVWTGTEMIVWGGSPSTNTGGRYNPSTNAWVATSTTSAPAARSQHTAVWTGTEMIVWGGSGSVNFNTGGRYNPSTDAWAATSTTSAPAVRYLHTAVWTGTVMIVWGGYNGAAYLNTGGRYNPSTDTWVATSTTSAPTARYLNTAVWAGSVMIVWGGYNGSSYFNSGRRYNPSTDTWAASGTSAVSAPSPRCRHTAVWTGTAMIVWAGVDGGHLNTGGRYCAPYAAAAPPVADGNPSGASGTPAKFVKSGNDIAVTWDNNTCNANNAVIEYGNIGSFTGYAGSADCSAGSTGARTFTSPAGDVWFNIVWENNSVAGHPGFATSGSRTWTATSTCDVAADNPSVNVCN
jgi:N-acetylneuraminic acid mutarotase